MLSPDDLLRMQTAQQAHMPDICHHLVYSSISDDYGSPTPTWTENTINIPCGLDQRPGSKGIDATDTVITYEATIRLPISELDNWDVKDRLLIIQRFGVVLDEPVLYWISSPIQAGPSGIRMLLKKVTV